MGLPVNLSPGTTLLFLVLEKINCILEEKIAMFYTFKLFTALYC